MVIKSSCCLAVPLHGPKCPLDHQPVDPFSVVVVVAAVDKARNPGNKIEYRSFPLRNLDTYMSRKNGMTVWVAQRHLPTTFRSAGKPLFAVMRELSLASIESITRPQQNQRGFAKRHNQTSSDTDGPLSLAIAVWRDFVVGNNHARNENRTQAVHSVCRSTPIILGRRLSISKTAEWPSSLSPARNKFSKSCA